MLDTASESVIDTFLLCYKYKIKARNRRLFISTESRIFLLNMIESDSSIRMVDLYHNFCDMYYINIESAPSFYRLSDELYLAIQLVMTASGIVDMASTATSLIASGIVDMTSIATSVTGIR